MRRKNETRTSLKGKTENHGMSGRPEYAAYINMLHRCYNPKHPQFHDYGGRGIEVCERWRASAVNFLEDMGKRPTKLHTLDRIDNEIGYSSQNCRWATRQEQQRNRRVSVFVVHDAQRRCLAEWAEITGLPATVIGMRVRSGWTAKEALTVPVRVGSKFEWQGRECTVMELAEIAGLSVSTMSNRLITHGWSVDRAMTEPVNARYANKRVRP
jgi:hypothetical protein